MVSFPESLDGQSLASGSQVGNPPGYKPIPASLLSLLASHQQIKFLCSCVLRESYFTIDFEGLHHREHGLVKVGSVFCAAQEGFLLEGFFTSHCQAL